MRKMNVLNNFVRTLLVASALLAAVGCARERGFEPLESQVRNAGDDGVAAYRIPGIVRTPKGTLIAVYDMRYRDSYDLQGDIDIGMSRSTDGGATWEKMKVIMDMGEWGGLPDELNGIGDPSILVDDNTGKVFVVAVWTHGLSVDTRAWGHVGSGMSPLETAQIMIVCSEDDGVTWSEPRNITSQVKNPQWRFTLQGPGTGITMKNGTLVFPLQYKDENDVPHSLIMYSTDGGESWRSSESAPSPNTTESAVVELEDGVLMLNMRNDLRQGRAIYTTSDYGASWSEHPTSRGTLKEPVCMASLIKVKAEDNFTGKDLLLFCNPDSWTQRENLTIRVSMDMGQTWPDEYTYRVDSLLSWGYSSLTLVDRDLVGVLYEGLHTHMAFKSIDLKDIIK